ncbi:MAG: phosphatase PAP2 family protein [Planctomycetes bacterium]|nr:phosphatase PAP2 family protein [Planctomycetota bacterium]
MSGRDSTSPRIYGRLRNWIFSREPVVLLSMLAIVVGIWGFVEVADEVMEQETQSLDERILLALRNPDAPDVDPIGPPWVEEMSRDFTALGGMAVLLLMTCAVCGFLWLNGQRRMVASTAVAVVGGVLVCAALKSFFDRPRPPDEFHLAHVYTASFPSGHSMMSAVVYLTLGALVAASVRRTATKLYAMGVAVLLTLLVGFSRVYLGVHWPTDVLAGWSAGLVWALGCWLVVRVLQQRGQVEPERGSALTPQSNTSAVRAE